MCLNLFSIFINLGIVLLSFSLFRWVVNYFDAPTCMMSRWLYLMLMMISRCFTNWVSHWGIYVEWFINYIFFIRGSDSKYKRNFSEILVDFRELEFLKTLYFRSCWRFSFFKWAIVSKYLTSSWLDSGKLRPIQGQTVVAMCRPPGWNVTI